MSLFEFEIINMLFGIVVASVASGTLTFVAMRIRRYEKEGHAVKDGMRAMLRDKLIQTYSKYVEDKSYCPYYVKEGISDVYEQYEKLGGNGAAKDIYQRIMGLPTSDPLTQAKLLQAEERTDEAS